MSRRARFTQADIRRAAKGAEAAGLAVSRVEIDPDGKIVIVFGQGPAQEPATALEVWRAKHAREA